MSDFDAVLERLLTDPAFAAALAADPDAALSGYALAAGEAGLLRGQVSPDAGAGRAAVEKRTTKSSMIGLVSAFADVGQGIGVAAAHAAGRAVHATQGLGDAPGASGSGGGGAARSGWGTAPGPDGASGLGDAPRAALGAAHRFSGEPEHQAPPAGYHNRVDADGDGNWDHATYRGGTGGGVDILVDLDHDGRADFVGHDTDADNRVDFADYDVDHDGVFDKRMYDDDGDGWLDRTVRRPHH
jgi:hypothetical protein